MIAQPETDHRLALLRDLEDAMKDLTSTGAERRRTIIRDLESTLKGVDMDHTSAAGSERLLENADLPPLEDEPKRLLEDTTTTTADDITEQIKNVLPSIFSKDQEGEMIPHIKPPHPPTATGDPHFTMFGNKKFDFQ